MQETRVHSLGRFPGEGNGNPFSILAWEIPWTEEPGDYTKSWTRPFGVQWSHKELDTTEHACTFIPPMIVLGLLSKIILINLCLFLCQCLIVLVVIAFILFFFFLATQHAGFCFPNRVSLVAQTVKNLPAMQETWVQSLGWEDPLEEVMATHSSILAWRIPMDRGAWQATVHGVAKSRTQVSD